jgi:hypothetical protein
MSRVRPFAPLYSTARWQRLRKGQLQAEPLCRYCLHTGRVEPATVCDHVNGHPAGETTEQFWAGPFQSLCRRCHDGTKRSQEATGRLRGSDVHGNPYGRPDWSDT